MFLSVCLCCDWHSNAAPDQAGIQAGGSRDNRKTKDGEVFTAVHLGLECNAAYRSSSGSNGFKCFLGEIFIRCFRVILLK